MNKYLVLFMLVFPTLIFSESLEFVIAKSIIINTKNNFIIEEKQNFISSMNDESLYQQVFNCQYNDHDFLLYVYCKMNNDIRLKDVSIEYDSPIIWFQPKLGSYQLLDSILFEKNVLTNSNENNVDFLYLFGNGSKYGKNDIAAFYIKLDNHKYFTEILIQVNNIWIDQGDPNISKLNTTFINNEIYLDNNNASIYKLLKKSFENARLVINETR